MTLLDVQLPPDLKPYESSLTGPGAKLVKITKSLCDLIARETTLLRERKTNAAQTLHGEKSKLIAEYKNTMSQLQVNEHLLGAKDSGERKYIKFITERLREVIRDHARLVLRLKSVAEGLIKSVGDEVAKQNRPVVAYGNNAGYQMPRTARPMSLSLNQVI